MLKEIIEHYMPELTKHVGETALAFAFTKEAIDEDSGEISLKDFLGALPDGCVMMKDAHTGSVMVIRPPSGMRPQVIRNGIEYISA